MMLKTIALTVASAAISALLVGDAAALPLAPLAQRDGQANILTLVADGCGPGNVRIKGECYREVKQEDDEDRPRRRARNSDDDDDQPRQQSRNRDNDNEDCPKGFRFSNSRQKCVEKTDPAVKVLNKLLFGSGNNNRNQDGNRQGNNQGNARNKGGCKPEPGCSCINGKLACR